MSKNQNLHNAKKIKNDEFYTQLSDIEKEMQHYKQHFKNKIVYCNCDNPDKSNFWRYFHTNFSNLELKKLICTYYDKNTEPVAYIYTGGKDNTNCAKTFKLKNGYGDFASDECIILLKQSDIIVTNPPFSLFRKYIAQLIKYNKKFLVIGSMNAIGYKEIFPLLKDNKIWLGCNGISNFITPEGILKKFGNIIWYTNLENEKKNKEIPLAKHFNPDDYPIYDNYCAFNVDKVSNIPVEKDFEMIVTEEKLNELKEKGFNIEILEVLDEVI